MSRKKSCIGKKSMWLGGSGRGPAQLGLVPLHVQRQVVAPGESPIAYSAFERLIAGVLAGVPRQFVGPGKPPIAFGPIALVRLLS